MLSAPQGSSKNWVSKEESTTGANDTMAEWVQRLLPRLFLIVDDEPKVEGVKTSAT